MTEIPPQTETNPAKSGSHAKPRPLVAVVCSVDGVVAVGVDVVFGDGEAGGDVVGASVGVALIVGDAVDVSIAVGVWVVAAVSLWSVIFEMTPVVVSVAAQWSDRWCWRWACRSCGHRSHGCRWTGSHASVPQRRVSDARALCGGRDVITDRGRMLYDIMPLTTFEIGETVRDREDPSAPPAVVVSLPAKTAANWLMEGGDTVAQTNPMYPADAPLVVVVAAADVGTYLPEWDAETPLTQTALNEMWIPYEVVPAPRLTTAEDPAIDDDSVTDPA